MSKWTITFEGEKGIIILEKVMCYMLSFNLKYTYIVFGYNDWNFDMSCYYNEYPGLKDLDHGIIKLKENDRLNIQFIYEMLNGYQMCTMYVNNKDDLMDDFDFSSWRMSDENYGGFVINDMLFDYMIIEKSDDLPDWGLLESYLKDGD